MLKGKQIAVIGLVVVLMGLLFSLDIKGLVKEDDGQHEGEAAQQSAAQMPAISLETISQAAKQTIDANLSQQITDLETKLKSASGSEKVELQMSPQKTMPIGLKQEICLPRHIKPCRTH
jgi:hypothetical protein